MLHDWLITENYACVPDLPMEMRPDLAVKTASFAITYDKSKRARYGFLKRNAKDAKDIKWFELKGHYTFHFANAWEEKNAQGHDVAYIYGCV